MSADVFVTYLPGRSVPRGLLAGRMPRDDSDASSHIEPRATRNVPSQLRVRDDAAGRMARAPGRGRQSAPMQVPALREVPWAIAAAMERHRRLALTVLRGSSLRAVDSRLRDTTDQPREKDESRAARITWRCAARRNAPPELAQQFTARPHHRHVMRHVHAPCDARFQVASHVSLMFMKNAAGNRSGKLLR